MERLIRGLAVLLLRAYPRASRAYMGDAYVEAAVHRWCDERLRAGSLRGTWRTLVWLLADVARAAPGEWWEVRQARRRLPLGAETSGIEVALQDLRCAGRRLRQSPMFALGVVGVLALAIGANTAILGVADAVLFRPLPYRDVDRLRLLQMADPVSGAHYFNVRNAYIQAIEAHGGIGEVGLVEEAEPLTVRGEAGAASLPSARVTANYFELLGLHAYRGRLLGPGDPPATEAGGVAVISFATWRGRYGEDERIVGGTVRLDGALFDVVGVLPPSFVFPNAQIEAPAVVTVMAPPAGGAPGGTAQPLVRLAPGVDPARAQAMLDGLASGLADPGGQDAGTVPVLEEVRGVLYAAGGPILKLLLASAALVLVLGCANLANFLLVRGKRLERETGVRVALGASRARVVRPILIESALLALTGAALAVVLSRVAFGVLLRWIPPVAYGGTRVGVDGRVALWTVALGLVTGLGFSFVPAWRAARTDPQALLRGGGLAAGGRGVLGRPMVMVQVALAVALVFGASLTGRVVVDMLRTPMGFEPEGAALVRVTPPERGLAGQTFYVDATETLARLPGVVGVAATGTVPLVSASQWSFVSKAPGGAPTAGVVHALPGYLDVAGIGLLRGRDLSPADVAGDARVAVVSEEAARRLFGSTDVLGRTFVDHRARTLTVVGVARDARYTLETDGLPPIYVLPGAETRRLTLVVRTTNDDPRLLEEVRREVARLAPDRVVTLRRWSDAIGALTEVRNPRFQALVLGGFATLALLLTSLGIAAVVGYLVASRTRELGIRLALGGTPGSVVRHVVGRVLTPVLLGALAGVATARVLAGFAEAQLFEVHADDPAPLLLATAAVVVVAAIAAYVPARRAAGIDPTLGQRVE